MHVSSRQLVYVSAHASGELSYLCYAQVRLRRLAFSQRKRKEGPDDWPSVSA